MADVNERVSELVCRLFVTLESAASFDPFCGSFSEIDADFLDFFHKTPLGLKAVISSFIGNPGKSGVLPPRFFLTELENERLLWVVR
jgi:hypothetical protein